MLWCVPLRESFILLSSLLIGGVAGRAAQGLSNLCWQTPDLFFHTSKPYSTRTLKVISMATSTGCEPERFHQSLPPLPPAATNKTTKKPLQCMLIVPEWAQTAQPAPSSALPAMPPAAGTATAASPSQVIFDETPARTAGVAQSTMSTQLTRAPF